LTPFDNLAAFLAARDDAEKFVAPAMRSRLLPGTDGRVFVLLHGLTASPPVWDAIASRLNARGATVLSLRLPLHGHADRLSTALLALTPELLTNDLVDVLTRVAALGMPITLGGHSLGGTLAVHGAAQIESVDRVVAVAPYLGISFLPQETHRLLIPLINALPNFFMWWDPILRERQLPAHGYPRYPLHALSTGLAIADAVYAGADRMPAARAIDLVINDRETSVNNRTVLRLARRWRAGGASVAIHHLIGLPPSHDVIEPTRPNSARFREALIGILCGEHVPEDRTLIL
jgi:pimeloyl-ACP methyl ester carboxylesterase